MGIKEKIKTKTKEAQNEITQPIEDIKGLGNVYKHNHKIRSTEERSNLLFVKFIKL